MSGIAVNSFMLLIKGIPEGMLAVLALYIFTRTKIDFKKYLLLSFVYVASTYLIRFLPITLGVNSVLSLFVLIIAYHVTYKKQLSVLIRTIASSAVILILVAVSEVFNMLLLTILYGQTKAVEFFNSTNGLTKGIYTIPSTIFFAALIFMAYLVLNVIEKRKKDNGKAGKKTGE